MATTSGSGVSTSAEPSALVFQPAATTSVVQSGQGPGIASATAFPAPGQGLDLSAPSSFAGSAALLGTASLQNQLSRVIGRDSRVSALTVRLQSSEADVNAIRALWEPSLGTSTDSDFNLARGASNSALVTVSQRLWDFGRTDAALETIEAQRLLARAQIEQVRQTVASEFLTSYLAYLSADSGIAADQAEIAAQRRALEANRTLASSGVASIVAAREVEITLNNALARQGGRELDRTQALQQMQSLAKGQVQPPSRGALEQFFAQYMDATPEACLARARSNDVDALVVQAQQLELERRIEEAMRDRMPSISLVGQTGVTPFGQSDDFGLRENTGINLAVNGNLFDGGASQAEVSRLNFQRQELDGEIEEILRSNELDVRRSYASVATSQQLIQTQDQTIGVLRQLAQDRQVQADAGIGLLQDVIEAEVAIQQAVIQRAALVADYDRERARLVLNCGHRF